MKHHSGINLRVITGSMFCGKNRRIDPAAAKRQPLPEKIRFFKPVIDNHYQVEKVTSHAGTQFDALPIQKSTDILTPRSRHHRGWRAG